MQPSFWHLTGHPPGVSKGAEKLETLPVSLHLRPTREGGFITFQSENCGVLLINGTRRQTTKLCCAPCPPSKNVSQPQHSMFAQHHGIGGPLNSWRVRPSKPSKTKVNKGLSWLEIWSRVEKGMGNRFHIQVALETFSIFRHWQPCFHTRVSNSGGSTSYINLAHAREEFFCGLFVPFSGVRLTHSRVIPASFFGWHLVQHPALVWRSVRLCYSPSMGN